MNFASDNVTGASPEVLAALVEANAGAAMPYGEDDWTARVDRALTALFETEVRAFPVATGTAANALALSVLAPAYGSIYCHRDSHIMINECGAPEFYSGGAKLIPVAGPGGALGAGKLSAAALAKQVAAAAREGVHHTQAAAVSVAQATEAGTLYSVDEITAIAATAHGLGLGVHMDGARFANAVVALDCSPADLTWRAGVDALSFGATKNGALAAEAVVFFEPALADTFAYRRKRGGHLFSKMRFLSAQLEAYLTDALWRRNAAHANAMAARLAAGLAAVPGLRLVHSVETNQVFVELPEAMIEGLLADGFSFFRMGGGETTIRLVTAFDTRVGDVDALIAAGGRHAVFAT